MLKVETRWIVAGICRKNRHLLTFHDLISKTSTIPAQMRFRICLLVIDEDVLVINLISELCGFALDRDRQ